MSRGEEMVVGRVFGEDATKILELLGEDATKFGEDATNELELLDGETTKTVEGEPVESAPGVKVPIEQPLIMDWPPPRVALLLTSASSSEIHIIQQSYLPPVL